MNKNKSKRKAVSLETKTAILKRIAEGEGSTALGREFGLGESTIRGIQKRAGEINQSNNYATNESAKRGSYSRNILIEKTEKALILWIHDQTHKRIPIDGELIKEKSIQFYNQLKDSEPSSSSSQIGSSKFSASTGWLAGFLQRHALHNLKIKGKAASADETAAQNYSKELKKVIEDGEYCSDQVSVIGKSEKTAGGFKAAKDRVTFLKSERPRALTGRNVSKLPVHFMVDQQEDHEQEEMTADKIYAGLLLCNKLEGHFLAIDTNFERISKFQKELQSCISGYRDIYKRLVKQ